MTHSDAPSVRLKFGLNCLHWQWNAINIRSRTQEDMSVPSYLDAVYCAASSQMISLVKKHSFDLVRLHIAWIKFYVRVWEFFNSAHTLNCSLCQFSQFNKNKKICLFPVLLKCDVRYQACELRRKTSRSLLCCVVQLVSNTGTFFRSTHF